MELGWKSKVTSSFAVLLCWWGMELLSLQQGERVQKEVEVLGGK